MAHFAQIDENNIVLQVLVVSNSDINDLPFPDSEPVGCQFLQTLFGPNTEWKQTSYNSNFRKNYAGIGYVYDSALNAFISPKPYPSWLLNTNTCIWEPPVAKPDDGKIYIWSEEEQKWVEYNK
jgi:hypothetical protein